MRHSGAPDLPVYNYLPFVILSVIWACGPPKMMKNVSVRRPLSPNRCPLLVIPTGAKRPAVLRDPSWKGSEADLSRHQPSPAGLEDRREADPSAIGLPRRAVGAALFPLLPQPDLGIHRRSTTMSNEIKETEPTNPLIWTALAELSPGRSPGLRCERRKVP